MSSSLSIPILIAAITIGLTFITNTYLKWLEIKWERKQKDEEYLRSRSLEQLEKLYYEIGYLVIKSEALKDFICKDPDIFADEDKQNLIISSFLDQNGDLFCPIELLIDIVKTNKMYASLKLLNLIYNREIYTSLNDNDKVEEFDIKIRNQAGTDYIKLLNICGIIQGEHYLKIEDAKTRNFYFQKLWEAAWLLSAILFMLIGGIGLTQIIGLSKTFIEHIQLISAPLTALGFGMAMFYQFVNDNKKA